MTIYIILFLLILFSTIFINTKRSKRNKRIYIIITFGLMTLVAMLRKYTIGIDLQYLYHPTFIKITNIMSKEDLEKNMLASFKHKFAKKPDVIEPNMEAVRRAWQEVKGGN